MDLYLAPQSYSFMKPILQLSGVYLPAYLEIGVPFHSDEPQLDWMNTFPF